MNFENFGKIKIPLPSLEEQKKVVEELNKIKENIQNAQKMIDNLNSSLSLSLSYGKKERATIRKLGDVATFEYGTYDRKAYDEGKYRLIRIMDIDNYGNISEKNKKYISLSKELSTTKFLLKGDVIVSRQAFPARVGVFKEEKAVLSSNLVKVRINEEVLLPEYFRWFALTFDWERQVKELTKGTAQPVFSANSLKEVLIPVLGLEKQREIIQEKEEEQKIITYQQQSLNLLKEKEKRFLENIWKK